MLHSFIINVSETDVAELKQRIAQTRWPAGVTDSGGISVSDVRSLLEAWEQYDWFAQQSALNEYPQFTFDGVHFVHLRSTAPDATPLLMLHGWPGSFLELLGVADRLRSAFHIVIPSIPGFGFSDIPTTPGMSNERISSIMAELMTALGYERFVAHGGDVGAGVASWLAIRHPSRIVALHLNYIPGSYGPPGPEDPDFQAIQAEWADRHYAYGHMQRTTPLTAAYGLSDSPAALAAWIGEKFLLWADPASRIPTDTLLTNLSIYWFTNTIASSMRYYLESSLTPLRLTERIAVPTHIARFPLEAPFPPRAYVERGYHVVRWTEMPRGAHFAALEAPDLLAADILAIV